MNDLMGILGSLDNAPPALIVPLACIALGYVLRSIPRFPNTYIPLLLVVFGMVVTPLMATPCSIWLHRVLSGLILGFVAWAAHGVIIKRLEDKIPGLSGMLGESQDLQIKEQAKEKQ